MKYKIFPDLTPEDFASLKRSIDEHGVENPVVVDETGETIDGFQREKACQELGLDCPTIVTRFDDDAEKYRLSLRVNCRRRNLDREQKTKLIEAYLRRDPRLADASLADLIGGVSKNTVAAIRERLEATRQIDKLSKTIGKDGKERPRHYSTIIANSRREVTAALEAVKSLPHATRPKIIDIITAKRRSRREQNRLIREARLIPKIVGDDSITLIHSPFQELDIEPNSANLILTDPPWEQAFLPQWEELGAFAKRVLVEGGLFVSLCGQFWLDKVLESLTKNLQYRWLNAILWPGSHPVRIGGWKEPFGRVLTQWRPVLIFSNGGFPKRGQWLDVLQGGGKEKDWHPWQQPLGEVMQLVKDFSYPGQLVVDPCGGGFTTAVACLRTGRRCTSCDIDAGCVERGRQRLAEVRQSVTTGAAS